MSPKFLGGYGPSSELAKAEPASSLLSIKMQSCAVGEVPGQSFGEVFQKSQAKCLQFSFLVQNQEWIDGGLNSNACLSLDLQKEGQRNVLIPTVYQSFQQTSL